ncbi:exonuclease SbcCD subunit D [Maribacter sp. 2307ULW6-5]|uniref:exonuclease SbcCD subunit D n=1 Tax=Maribacter sp. 2307ULW6-5 TaxID=3386275 RepID=UPI0039BD8CF7
MKILHTSDWHIGKQLHKYDLAEDLQCFFDWLIGYLEAEAVDVLLVSGDVFDQANPSQAAYKQYYDVLRQLTQLPCKIVITGGNHDSAAVLNAPRELLKAFDITVIGGATEQLEDVFVPIEKNGQKLVVAAVPFLKDRDIRKSAAGESYATKIEQVRAGLQGYFSDINTHYTSHFSDAFFVVMGHLYVQGSAISESEREIQVGNQAGVSAAVFQGVPDYVALGHIHKPQVVSQEGQIHYCGSPISLSFSEREDQKQVNVITLKNNKLAHLERVPVPKGRNLLTFSGSLEEVRQQLLDYNAKTPLLSLAEVVVNEATESLERRQAFEALLNDAPNPLLQIVKSRLTFANKVRGASEAFAVGTDVADVTPMQMFTKKLELQSGLENTEELKAAFKDILQELGI